MPFYLQTHRYPQAFKRFRVAFFRFETEMLSRLRIPQLLTCLALMYQAPGALLAQADIDFESISLEQGLSQGMIYDLLQDREGFLWVATKDGLNRYDGYDFKVFTNDPYDPWSLSSNTIICLFEDSKGRIWVGTENSGLNVYDKKSGRFLRIQHRPEDASSLSGNRISAIGEDPLGQILVGVYKGGLNIITLPETFIRSDSTPLIRRKPIPGDQNVEGIALDGQGRSWISGTDKIYSFDPATTTLSMAVEGYSFSTYCKDSSQGIFAGSELSGIFWFDGNRIQSIDSSILLIKKLWLDSGRRLWISQIYGLYILDLKNQLPGQYTDRSRLKLKRLLDNPLASMVMDQSGQIWLGTRGYGLLKINPNKPLFNHQLAGITINQMVVRPPELLYVSHGRINWKGWGYNQLDSTPLQLAFSGRNPNCLLISRKGAYYGRFYDPVKLETELLTWHPKNGNRTRYVFNAEFDETQPMLEDRNGKIWMAGFEGLLTRLDPNTGQIDYFKYRPGQSETSKSSSTVLYEDRQGSLWIGSQVGFAKTENPGSGQPEFKWYSNNPEDRNSLNYNHVSCFLEDPAQPDRYIWIATKGGGLNRLDKQSGAFLHLTTEQGLPNNVVYGILSDAAGNIWGSSNKGIFCLSLDTDPYVIRHFSSADGLQNDEFNTSAYVKMPDGTLAFGGVNGINRFHPETVLSIDFKPHVFITNILINNEPVKQDQNSTVLKSTIETSSSISLTHEQDILTLEFASLDFTSPKHNLYRYQLIGADENWVESKSRRTATYLHLPPGSYTFRVQGSNSRGIWSPHIAELKIVVMPPWWRTWWAWLSYAAILALVIRNSFRFYLNREKLKSRLAFETREAERIKELDSVRTQLYTNITHEFRTPLTIILGMARQAFNESEGSVRKSLEMIMRNGQNLLKLVNELLDLSKLDSGKMSLNPVRGDVIGFFKYLFESYHSLGASRNIQLHFLSDLDQFTFTYDPEKLRQVFSNLLSNAIKFTPEGGNVYFSISQKTSGEGKRKSLVMKVKDTGIGIPEDKIAHVFDRFYQINQSQTSKNEGSGIGLSLTRELIKLMDGEITVKSPAPGSSKGSEFTVWLPELERTDGMAAEQIIETPVELTPPVQVAETISFSAEQKSGKARLLLVEDNADVVAYVASCLPDYALQVANDGLEGLEMATDNIPDLIISDVMMPRMDGFEFCKRIKADERTSHIPIIILTAKADIGSKMEGLNLGVDAYLEKPFYQEELLVRIKKLLELRRQLQNYYLKTAGLQNGNATPSDAPEVIPTEDAFILKAREIVEAHLTDYDFNVEQFCKEMHLSHSQLHRKLDALTGMSANQFIRSLRLKKAKSLLLQAELSITAVAFDSGFNDPGYFGRVFKQEFGVTPMEWRQNSK
ncbi:MAG TPA: ATP-binding protein [Saprospiraceae bacterium]|nr:ATP-binding protein [Saprospiraceae bacterium]